MANTRISQLPAATTVASPDVIPFSSISGSETRKITANNLALRLVELGLTVGTSEPASPYNGQLFVDTTTNPPVLKVYNGASFTIVSFLPGSSVATSPGTSAPANPALGQLWLDTSQDPDELKIYDGANFVRVDPVGISQTDADARYEQITDAADTYLALAGGTMTGTLTLDGDPTTDNQAANKAYVDTEISNIPAATDLTPAGTIMFSARTTAPPGYLHANGAAVSRTDFDDLFAAIGTTYGAGDGSTTFNLPDLQNQFLRGASSTNAVGTTQSSQNKSHSHTATSTTTGGSHGHSGSTASAGGHSHTTLHNIGSDDNGDEDYRPRASRLPDSTLNLATGAVGNHTHSVTVSSSGNLSISTSTTINDDGGTEARPQNMALLPCIKT